MTRLPIWIMRLSGATGFWGKMRDDGKITQMAYAAAVVENITLKRPEAMEKIIMWKHMPIIVRRVH